MKLKVHSLRVEYIRTYNNRDCNFEDNKKYILNCVSEHMTKYELSLWTLYGDCCSGYCAASWGHGNIRIVDDFIGMTHMPIKELSFELDIKENDDYVNLSNVGNNIFGIDWDGGDDYYPGGRSWVNEKLFRVSNRMMNKRPVWIFKGDSVLGKSYLAGIISNSGRTKIVYETDSYKTLTKEIEADIIVVGNKYNHSLEEIESKIKGEHEIIYVDFSKK